MSFEDLLVTGALWSLAVAGVWAVLVCAAAVAEVVSSGRWALTGRLGCPAAVRRALLGSLGLLLAGGGTAVCVPASATRGPEEGGEQTAITLPVPARPTGSVHAVPPQVVEVRSGDSLWRLAQRRAARRASNHDLARLVAQTYRANRAVIGPDPDLLQPGQRLRVPRQRPDLSARETPPHGTDEMEAP